MARSAGKIVANIAVIGAGIGGMSAGARLAKAGHDVTIYENSERSGGKCRTEWFGDYAFDTGPSLLTLPAVYRDLFLKTGKRIEHILNIKPVDPAFNYHFSDGSSVLFPNLSNPYTYIEIEKSYGLVAGNQWKELIKRAERMWEVSREPFIESELKSIFSLLKRKNLLREIKDIAPFTSLRKLSEKLKLDPHLRMIVDRYATYTGSDPRSAPAVLLTIAFVESTFGAWHIEGGVGQLSAALEQRCTDLGVKFKFNTLVTQILVKNNQTIGVRTSDGIDIKSDLVVANSDAEYIYNKLLPKNVSGARTERRKLKLATKSLSGFSLLLGLDNSKGEAVSIDHHNVYFPNNYDDEFDDIFTKRIPVTDPTIYICAPKDSQMTKGENKEAWFVLVNAPRHQVDGGWDWQQGGAEYGQKIIKKLDDLGLNVTPRLDFMKYRTPADLENYAMAPGGSIYGSSSNSAVSAFLRTKNRSKIKGLFCVGGSSHPGGGLPLVGISAEIVANAIGKA
ncbi:MAG: phytoene desaturase family protein [Actinomycetota bacterium]|nr:phytoene desaturase family protein [Actinomycetota bacterium]